MGIVSGEVGEGERPIGSEGAFSHQANPRRWKLGSAGLLVVAILLSAGWGMRQWWLNADLHRSRDAGKIRGLLRQGAWVDHRGPYGNTPLMVAAKEWAPEAVQALLEGGADPNARNEFGQTALMAACSHSEDPLPDSEFDAQRRVVALLLAAGAQVNARDPSGATALQYAEVRHTGVLSQLRKAGATR